MNNIRVNCGDYAAFIMNDVNIIIINNSQNQYVWVHCPH